MSIQRCEINNDTETVRVVLDDDRGSVTFSFTEMSTLMAFVKSDIVKADIQLHGES